MKVVTITILLCWFFLRPASAQEFIITVQGDTIKAHNIDFGEKYIYYHLADSTGALIHRISQADIMSIKQADNNVVPLDSVEIPKITEKASADEEKRLEEIPLSSIHGLIIAKGNCVYIPVNSAHEYERAGQAHLKKLIEGWNYWKVVDTPTQAHFILQFVTTLYGRDYSHVMIRKRESYDTNPTISFLELIGIFSKSGYKIRRGTPSGETTDENIQAAGRLYMFIQQDPVMRNQVIEQHDRQFLIAE